MFNPPQNSRFNVLRTVAVALGFVMLIRGGVIAQPTEVPGKDKATEVELAAAIVGKFADGTMTMVVEQVLGKYQGTITRDDKSFPFAGELKGAKLLGQVDIAGVKSGFTATIEDDVLILTLGLDTRRLPRVVIVPPGEKARNTIRKEVLLASGVDVQHGSEVASPDNRRIGFVIHREGHRHVVIDGVESKAYHRPLAINFSPDSKRHFYVVDQGAGKWNVVVNGVEGETYEALLENNCRFSLDSKRVAYAGLRDNKWRAVIDGRQGDAYDDLRYITFSPDSKRVGFAIRRGKVWHAVIDGVEGEAFDAVGREGIVFSPDSKRVAYTAIKDGSQFTVVDGMRGKPYEAIGGFAFSPDSVRTCFVARRSGQAVFVVDGQDQGAYDAIHNLSFSPDGKHTVLGVRHEGKVFHVINDRAEAGYEDVTAPIFSSDGQQLAYAGKMNGKWSTIREAKPGKRHEEILSMTYSPDGRRLAYVAVDDKKARVVIDAFVSVRYDSIWNQPVHFTPDSKHWIVGAGRGADTFLVVDSVEDKPVGSFVPGSVPVFEGNDRFQIIIRRGSKYYRLDVRINDKPA